MSKEAKSPKVGALLLKGNRREIGKNKRTKEERREKEQAKRKNEGKKEQIGNKVTTKLGRRWRAQEQGQRLSLFIQMLTDYLTIANVGLELVATTSLPLWERKSENRWSWKKAIRRKGWEHVIAGRARDSKVITRATRHRVYVDFMVGHKDVLEVPTRMF